MFFSHFTIWSLTSRILVKFFSNPSQTGRIKEELLLMLQRFYKVKQQLGVDRRKSCRFKTLYGFRDEGKIPAVFIFMAKNGFEIIQRWPGCGVLKYIQHIINHGCFIFK